MQIFGKTGTIRLYRAKRYIFTATIAVAVLAASSRQMAGQEAAARPATSRTGRQLVQQAARDLANCPSLEVRLRQRVAAFDKQLVGSGIYLHQYTEQGLRIRLELKLQVADSLTTVLQVSDGQFLWLRRDMPHGTSLGRVDLERLNAAWSAGGNAKFAAMPASLLASGGLPRLLASIAENFSFHAPVVAQLDSTPVWLVQGQWTPQVLAKLFPNEQDKILEGELPDLRRLPRQMPTSVDIVLRQPDLMPLRIDYRRLSCDDSTEAGNHDESLLVMEFYGVRHHESLDDGLFRYEPGSQEVEDLTSLYLRKLLPEETQSLD